MLLIQDSKTLSDIIQENSVGGKLSFSAAARLLEIHHSSLINAGGFVPKKLTQTLTEQGFTACGIQNQGFCAKSFWLTLEYFAYDSKAKAPGAKQLARTFGQIGVMAAFEKLSEPSAVKPELTAHERIQDAKDLYSLPDGYLKELLRDMMVAELSQKALPSSQIEYTTAKVRAKELGYSTESIGNGSQLGKYLKQNIEPSFNERVGKYNVYHYEINPRLDETIHSFFR
ncbi:MAG: hypothetical protein ACRC80_25970 [Waterburya sp.]